MLPKEEREILERELGRSLRPAEEALFSVLWSEHCSYKTSRPHLRQLPTRAPWVLQGPGENAGIVRLRNGWCVAFKVESHNHPSAVEPFHGAATGVGGIIRDILSVGARPVALLDSLRFGPPADSRSKYLFDGVVSGISWYGNSVGVPTVAGEVRFHPRYSENPLVNAMCVGLMREGDFVRARLVGSGNPIILAGATTGRDGIGGAAFASEDLTGDADENLPAVQIGDPFMEKLLIEATLEAFKTGAVLGAQDLGAGGLSGLAEMALKGGVGAEIHLDRVPLRVPNMKPWEILISESQERMVLCVQKGREAEILEIYRRWGLNAVVIGEVLAEPVFRALYRGEVEAEFPVGLLGRVPERNLPQSPRPSPPDSPVPEVEPAEVLLRLLSHPDVASKRWVYEQYDHMVQINTVLRPGQADAAVLRVKGESFGIALSIDCFGQAVHLSPRLGAARCALEALRNIVAVGARPLGITDCLNYANPEDPKVMWEFAESVAGLAEACRELGVPVVSGNVSFYNQTERVKVLPTPTIGAVGILDDVRQALTMALKPGHRVVLLGKPLGLAGSLFRDVYGGPGKLEPVDYSYEKALWETVWEALPNLSACHDVSETGLLPALAEMAAAGGVGAETDLESEISLLFGEFQGFICATEDPEPLLRSARSRGVDARVIGVARGERLSWRGGSVALSEIREALESLNRLMDEDL